MLTLASNLLQYILRELEKSPSRLFRASELKQISIGDFNHLVKERLLVYHQYDPKGDFYPCLSRCPATCDRVIGRIRGKWEALCTDGEADTKSIPLTEDDITKYSFDINRLIEEIKRQNDIGGNPSELDKRLYFVGSRKVQRISTGIIIGFFNNPKTAELLLLSIQSRTIDYKAILVLMPFFDKTGQDTLVTLEGKNIHPVGFSEAFSDNNWILNSEVFSKISGEEYLYQFCQSGVVWDVVFAGNKTRIEDSFGAKYIAILLNNPEKKFSAVELYQTAHRTTKAPDELDEDTIEKKSKKAGKKGVQKDAVVDSEALSAYREQYQELKQELSDAERDDDLAAQGRINKQITELGKYISGAKDQRGQIRRFTDVPERARQSVSKAIERAIKNIKLPDFKKHLQNSMKPGTAIIYEPEEDFNWFVTMSSNTD